MVAITWLDCIVAFPASLQFSSSVEYKYQYCGQNAFLSWNVAKKRVFGLVRCLIPRFMAAKTSVALDCCGFGTNKNHSRPRG